MKKTVVSAAEGQAVIVTLKLTSDAGAERIYALEDKLSPAIAKPSAGEFAGESVNAPAETANHRWSAVISFADPLKMEIQ
jgi:hypothetical protein